MSNQHRKEKSVLAAVRLARIAAVATKTVASKSTVRKEGRVHTNALRQYLSIVRRWRRMRQQCME